MLFFPNAKINIGLNITEKRSDGFHNLETVFYPVNIQDSLEFVETEDETTISISGIELDVDEKKNICYQAYMLMVNHYSLPKLKIHLHKFIPTGAGLGGGSADAAFLMKELNNYFNLGISNSQLQDLAAQIGSDCAFFIENKPVYAYGRGEKFKTINLDLSSYYLYVIKPDIFVSSGIAFKGIKPQKQKKRLKDLIIKPIEQWKTDIHNHFELTIFKEYPQLNEIKQYMYSIGAVYASMSGSGSAIYGIFDKKPNKIDKYKTAFNWIGKL